MYTYRYCMIPVLCSFAWHGLFGIGVYSRPHTLTGWGEFLQKHIARGGSCSQRYNSTKSSAAPNLECWSIAVCSPKLERNLPFQTTQMPRQCNTLCLPERIYPIPGPRLVRTKAATVIEAGVVRIDFFFTDIKVCRHDIYYSYVAMQPSLVDSCTPQRWRLDPQAVTVGTWTSNFMVASSRMFEKRCHVPVQLAMNSVCQAPLTGRPCTSNWCVRASICADTHLESLARPRWTIADAHADRNGRRHYRHEELLIPAQVQHSRSHSCRPSSCMSAKPLSATTNSRPRQARSQTTPKTTWTIARYRCALWVHDACMHFICVADSCAATTVPHSGVAEFLQRVPGMEKHLGVLVDQGYHKMEALATLGKSQLIRMVNSLV